MNPESSFPSLPHSSALHPLRRLALVESALRARGPKAVLPFHRVYTVVTRSVLSSAQEGGFEAPHEVERQVARFLHYYEKALADHRAGGVVPPAWSLLFSLAEQDRAKNMLALSLGVNAHVINDLPQALADLGVGPRGEKDFFHIDTVISRRHASIIEAAQISLGPLDPAVKVGMSVILPRWRKDAWRACLNIRDGTLTPSDLERAAGKRAGLLMRVPWPR